jgi:hypothetical protein
MQECVENTCRIHWYINRDQLGSNMLYSGIKYIIHVEQGKDTPGASVRNTMHLWLHSALSVRTFTRDLDSKFKIKVLQVYVRFDNTNNKRFFF